MKLSINTNIFSPSTPLPYIVENISRLEYDGIELNALSHGAEMCISPHNDPERRRELVRLISKSGLKVSSVCAHKNIADPKERARRESVDYIKECIRVTREFETDILHVASGSPGPGANRDAMMTVLIEEIQELIDESTKNCVRLALEAAVNQLVYNSASLDELIRRVGGGLYVNFDPSHFAVAGEDPAQVVRRFGPRIIHSHAKDSKGTPAKFEFPPFGMGMIDFKKLADAFRSIGYDDFASVEYEGHHFGYEGDPLIVAARAREFLLEHGF